MGEDTCSRLQKTPPVSGPQIKNVPQIVREMREQHRLTLTAMFNVVSPLQVLPGVRFLSPFVHVIGHHNTKARTITKSDTAFFTLTRMSSAEPVVWFCGFGRMKKRETWNTGSALPMESWAPISRKQEWDRLAGGAIRSVLRCVFFVNHQETRALACSITS